MHLAQLQQLLNLCLQIWKNTGASGDIDSDDMPTPGVTMTAVDSDNVPTPGVTMTAADSDDVLHLK